MNFLFILLLTISTISSESLDPCNKSSDLSRVVIAGGSITEIIYMLELNDHLAAVDVTSNYPESAKTLPSVGYVRNLSTEGILSLNPSLLLGENDIGPHIVIEQLREIGLDMRIIPEDQSSKGIVEKVYCIGKIMGLSRSEIKRKTKKLEESARRLDKLVNEGLLESTSIMFVLNIRGSTPIIAGKGTSGDGFISMIGCQNVFKNIEGWKAISEESVLEVNPDYIILPDENIHKGSGIKTILDNPIFMNTRAGKSQNFIFEDAMAMLGFGPRTLHIASEISELIIEKNKVTGK